MRHKNRVNSVRAVGSAIMLELAGEYAPAAGTFLSLFLTPSSESEWDFKISEMSEPTWPVRVNRLEQPPKDTTETDCFFFCRRTRAAGS